MTDPNATMTREEARGPTRMQKAIDVTHLARRERNEGTTPTQRFWLGVARNFVLGLPCAGQGFVWLHEAERVLQDRLVKCGCRMEFTDLKAFLPGAAMLLLGIAFVAPGQTEAVARYFGLGTLIDRLPFLRPTPLRPNE